MSLGNWLNNLSAFDHVILLIIFFIGIYFSQLSLKAFIKFYEEKTNYSKYRIQFRITPISLLSIGFFFSYIIYRLLKLIFDFIP